MESEFIPHEGKLVCALPYVKGQPCPDKINIQFQKELMLFSLGFITAGIGAEFAGRSLGSIAFVAFLAMEALLFLFVLPILFTPFGCLGSSQFHPFTTICKRAWDEWFWFGIFIGEVSGNKARQFDHGGRILVKKMTY